MPDFLIPGLGLLLAFVMWRRSARKVRQHRAPMPPSSGVSGVPAGSESSPGVPRRRFRGSGGGM